MKLQTKLHLLLPLLVLFIYTPLQGQITGTVRDSLAQTPIEQLAVRLLHLPDSALVSGNVTTLNGNFTLAQPPKGNYLLHFSYLGYEDYYQPITVQTTPIALAPTLMSESTILLQESVIVGKMPGMVVRNDTVEYQPDAYVTTPNAVVEDLLKKLPGVEVDEDGNITVNGEKIKKIMVDGKEFFANDPQLATSSLPVDAIERLQVLEKKSELEELTGIDDGEREYVINLAVKPDRKHGIFGRAVGAYGNHDRYEANGMVNSFSDVHQLSVIAASGNTSNRAISQMGGGSNRGLTTAHRAGINGSYSAIEGLKLQGNLLWSGYNNEETRTSFNQNFLSDGSSRLTDRVQSNFSEANQFNGSFRLDYTLDSLTRIQFNPSASFRRRNTGTVATYATQSEVNADSIYRLNDGSIDNAREEDYYLVGANLSISRGFAKKGRRVTANVYANKSQTEAEADNNSTKQLYNGGEATASPTLIKRLSDQQIERNTLRTRLFYTEPITKRIRLQLSYQFSREHSNNNKRGETPDPNNNGTLMLDSAQTNRFESNFYTHRMEIGLRHYMKGLNYSVGVVLEPAIMEGFNYQCDTLHSNLRKAVFNAAPYLDLTMPISKEQSLKLSYRSNTRQPTITMLQPVPDLSNPNVIREGNSELKPTFTSTFRLNYNHYNKEKQQSLVVSVSGNIMQNSITYYTEYDDQGVKLSRPVNVNGVWNAYGNVLYNSAIGKSDFRFASNSRINTSRSIGFIADKKQGGDGLQTQSNNYTAFQRLKLTYFKEWIEVITTADYTYNLARHSMETSRNADTWNLGGRGELVFHFPWNIAWSTSYHCIVRHGYSAELNRPQHLLNTEVKVPLFKNKRSVLSFQMFDILQQQLVSGRTVRSDYIEDYSYNTLSSYFMVNFSYQIRSMGGKIK